MKKIFLFSFVLSTFILKAQLTPFYSKTRTYDSIIACYKQFDKKSPMALLKEAGTTDIGKPLHLFILSKDQTFDAVKAKQKGKAILLINNGIHPGEPDGIDASIEMVNYYLTNPDSLPANIVILIIPVYNVDGCLNRNNTSRANQNGPEEYGFRGNAKNLDLNRDFIKCDAENTKSLEKIFAEWNPDVFVDTHVSDGADYQYTMTLISTSSKLQHTLGTYMKEDMTPSLYKMMSSINDEMCPYVDEIGNFPDDKGISAFLETPRFSTGYAGLRNCIGYVTETHMLKNYNQRVWSTYHLLQFFIIKTSADAKKIIKLHKSADDWVAKQSLFDFNLVLDTSLWTEIDFKGYEAKYRKSDLSAQSVMYYDETSPFKRKIRYYSDFIPSTVVTVPSCYIIPQVWSEVIARLKINGVKMSELKKDTMLYVSCYYITDYHTGNSPYESHYVHSGVAVKTDHQDIQYYQGDYVVKMDQALNAYIATVLEPQSNDSYFCWNFFDGILQQKEWFSDYVFETKADSLLKVDASLKSGFDLKMKTDTAFANDHWQQLSYIYRNSAYLEKTFDRYPVTRLDTPVKLPLE
ncbi:MAG TPA: M14 family zinc carboxypeptidase [Bacteroidia bacterium]|jgi:hypothetical protein|nr:M14 family zinc carboxypeptidase [Bacteroidia bacterium]